MAGELPLERDDEVESLRCQHSARVRRQDGHGGGLGAHPVRAASNCASSVEPLSASVELWP